MTDGTLSSPSALHFLFAAANLWETIMAMRKSLGLHSTGCVCVLYVKTMGERNF